MGGLRYSSDVDLDEIRTLAALTTWKCAMTNIPYGGPKGGVQRELGKFSCCGDKLFFAKELSEL